ncbi:MAG: PAS domain S-box protein, partial [Alphaproteobacteria bacterium]|nr:PAS domain S-box protein [Alphaproteobacteria bacterium]
MSKFTKISDLASWAVALLCLAFLGVLWAGIVVELQLYRGRVIEREFRHNDNLVKIFAEQVNRSFRAAETTLADIANSYLRLGDGFDLVGYFTDRKLHLDPARSLAILDDKGDLVLSNLPLQRRLNFAESAHIRRHSTNPSTDILIGPPVLGAITGKWTMFLSRRISRTDGGYAGSALYGVDTDHFRDLFRELDLGADASYALVGLDGIARSRNIDGNPDTGMDYRQSPLFHADLKKAKSGHFLRPSPRDGVMRLTSYTVLERYGMVVLFALTEDAALAEYRIDRQKYLKVGAGGTVLILVLGLVALVLLRRAALAEERHKTSEDRLALVENAIHDGVWDWEIATGSDYLSPHWKALLGYRDEELPNVAATFSDRLHPDDAAPTRAALNSHFETGTPFSMELRLRHRDGGYRWFLTRGEALRDAAGKPYRMIGGLTDIDARKRSEETLARTQAQLTSMVDSAMDAIVTVDDRMRIVGFNLSASRLFNCKREDAIGLALERFIPTRYRGEHEGQMRAFAESGATKRSMGRGA